VVSKALILEHVWDTASIRRRTSWTWWFAVAHQDSTGIRQKDDSTTLRGLVSAQSRLNVPAQFQSPVNLVCGGFFIFAASRFPARLLRPRSVHSAKGEGSHPRQAGGVTARGMKMAGLAGLSENFVNSRGQDRNAFFVRVVGIGNNAVSSTSRPSAETSI